MNKVKELREALNLSVNDFSIKSGLSRQAIYNIESGRVGTNNIRLGIAKKISLALNRRIEEIF